jgi:uncharacterized ferritin-like protein (DUF455 family)
MNSTADYVTTAPGFVHDVETNARRLGFLYSLEVEMSRLVGSWIHRSPELPEKLLLGRVLYEDADHALSLEGRMRELRVSDEAFEAMRLRTCPAFKILENLSDPLSFWTTFFRVVKPALVAEYTRHLIAAPPFVDDPTVRILRSTIAEEQEHIGRAGALLNERGVAWDEHLSVDAEVRKSLWNFDASDGGLDGGVYVGQDPLSVDRPTWPADVEHLSSQEPMPPYPDSFEGGMQRLAHDLVFSETEALDIFGRYVYELQEFPWQFSQEAARIAWDEARHVELLLNVLNRYGGHIGQFPAKSPGYEEYVSQPTTIEKIIMVNVIAEGEVSTDTQTQHRDSFRELGDELSAILKDYEMADEVSHGRFGIKWAQWLVEHTGADYGAAYTRARSALDEFKSMHDDEETESPIPLVRLGIDETGPNRTMNFEAKKLVGFTDEEITRLKREAEGGSRS